MALPLGWASRAPALVLPIGEVRTAFDRARRFDVAVRARFRADRGPASSVLGLVPVVASVASPFGRVSRGRVLLVGVLVGALGLDDWWLG